MNRNCDACYRLVSDGVLRKIVATVSQSDFDVTTSLMIIEVIETACYLGAALSASIARRIYGMREKTFINKMFLWYFAVDAIMGTLNTFLLFRVQRFVFKLQKLNYILMKRVCVCACATSCYLIIEHMSVEPK